jgi:pimeloyl-ACP methyl ester carboxylesterase
MTLLPGKPESCWTANAPETRYPSYEDSDQADVAIIGGGIVGLTAAYLLANAGLAVTVLEARRIGRGVTGRSTAKITCQHTLIYAHLARTLGIDKARLYAQANLAAVAAIIRLAETLRIECDLERKSAYVYAVRDDRRAFTRHIWNEWFVAYKPDDAEFERTAISFDNPDWAAITLHSYRSRWGHAEGDPAYAELEARFDPVPRQRVPTLTLHGSLDPVNLPQMSEGKEAYFAGAYERRLIDGAGHFPQRERPDDVVEHVIGWLRRHC